LFPGSQAGWLLHHVHVMWRCAPFQICQIVCTVYQQARRQDIAAEGATF